MNNIDFEKIHNSSANVLQYQIMSCHGKGRQNIYKLNLECSVAHYFIPVFQLMKSQKLETHRTKTASEIVQFVH